MQHLQSVVEYKSNGRIRESVRGMVRSSSENNLEVMELTQEANVIDSCWIES